MRPLRHGFAHLRCILFDLDLYETNFRQSLQILST